MTTPTGRRDFLRRGLTYAGGAVLAPSLIGLAACNDAAPDPITGVPTLRRATRGAGGYGALLPANDGIPLLIPAGFTVMRLSRAGDDMRGGRVPNAFDGMAAFAMPNGNTRLVRNHEIRTGAAASVPFGTNPYDVKGPAGCTTVEVRENSSGTLEVVEQFVSISGTHVNCAGGPTPWGSWMTCEETTEGLNSGRMQKHGYVFDVPASANDEIVPVALPDMGRMSHEAVAVDPISGHIYETEDAGNNSGFYRFVPVDRANLSRGGKLQMLAVDDRPQFNTTRGGVPRLTPLAAHWVDVPDPDPDLEGGAPTCFTQGLNNGGTRFARLEGAWWADGSCFFNATSGGSAGAGQVWQYRPMSADHGQLILVFESPNRSVLDAPDNICVSPRGGLVLCEDGGGDQFLRGLTRTGEIFDLVSTGDGNNDSEFAGACFSPDGKYLFVNQQGSTSASFTGALAETFAITGPWAQGVL